MIDADQEKLIFIKLELTSCREVIQLIEMKLNALKTNEDINFRKIKDTEDELKSWENKFQALLTRVFEMEVLLGVEV